MNPTLDRDRVPVAGHPLDRLADPIPVGDDGGVQMVCALRHLAVASTRLARQEDISREDAARYAAAEARFRSMLEPSEGFRPWNGLTCPAVETEAGEAVSLADLLIGACRKYQRGFPSWSIDPALVEAARDLLCSLQWTLPA